ncbi:MAG: histidine phosphatase family protein [Bacteriovoracaceae bacterium]
MEKELYLFRHGETDWNKAKRIQGHIDIPLNDTGRSQATTLGEKLKETPLDIIYTSDLQRAFETAKIVRSKNSYPLISDTRLRELHLGEAQGLTKAEAHELVSVDMWDTWRDVRSGNLNISLPGGETRLESITRFNEFFDSIALPSEHRVIGISLHGGILINVLYYKLREKFSDQNITNCACYRVKIKGAAWQSVEKIN